MKLTFIGSSVDTLVIALPAGPTRLPTNTVALPVMRSIMEVSLVKPRLTCEVPGLDLSFRRGHLSLFASLVWLALFNPCCVASLLLYQRKITVLVQLGSALIGFGGLELSLCLYQTLPSLRPVARGFAPVDP